MYFGYLQIDHVEGKIVETSCACAIGVYKCSHACALYMFAIFNLGRTDEACKWKRRKTQDEEKLLARDMYPRVRPELTRPSQESKANFLDAAATLNLNGLNWGDIEISKDEENNNTIPQVFSIINSGQFISTPDPLKIEIFKTQITCTREEIEALAEATKGQRTNPLWMQSRRGRLTASNFGPALRAKRAGKTIMKKVTADFKGMAGIKSLQWGLDHEQDGFQAASVTAKALFSDTDDVSVTETGLWLTESGILGASPDGLIGANGILEIKCPCSLRKCTSIKNDMKADFYMELIDGQHLQLKKNHDYWHQVQGQMYVCQKSFCLFYVWTPNDYAIDLILKDPEWVNNMEKLESFYLINK